MVSAFWTFVLFPGNQDVSCPREGQRRLPLALDKPPGPGHTGMLLCVQHGKTGTRVLDVFQSLQPLDKGPAERWVPPSASFPLTDTQNAPCSQAIWVSGMCLWTSAKMKIEVSGMICF